MRTKNKTINSKALTDHARKIFTLTQPLPASVYSLLAEKRKRQLTQKQQKQIYDQMKQKNVFPVLTSPKTIIDFCLALSSESYRAGTVLGETDDLLVILDGAIKVFEEVVKNHSPISQNLRLSLSSGIAAQTQSHRIERQKLGVGQVLIFPKDAQHLLYIVASSVLLLRIPYEVYSVIALSSYMVQIKKKQQFFSKIPLFQKHYRSSLQDFVASLEEVECGFGKKIFSEGDTIKDIYIVKEGEFILLKSISTDDLIVKQGKITTKHRRQNSQDFPSTEIKNVQKHFRSCPFKIIGPKQILGDCEYMLNNKTHLYSMRCHKEGSKLYTINAELFYKKLLVSQNGIERVNNILQQNYQAINKQIDAQVKFNKSNTLILKFMPNSTLRYRTQQNQHLSNNLSTISQKSESAHNSTQRSFSFFQKMNKTIINQNKCQIRKRNQSRNAQLSLQNKTENKKRKTFKTPAVVQEVVHIVNQKRAYHRLRNMGMEKKNAFEFDINNVPPFIKKKYGHILDRKKSP